LKLAFGALLLSGGLALVIPRVAGQQTMPAGGDETAKRLQNSFVGLATKDAPGFAVLVKQNGAVLLEQGFGARDLRGKARIDAHSNFRLASCTKQFTAMAAMLLVHDGKLRYGETLTEIFAEFPAYGKFITVQNLLNHTSGLPDYEGLMAAAEKANGPLWSSQKQIRDDEVLLLL
jgi:CubicO group peptidase (beta-lactamase class C family)